MLLLSPAISNQHHEHIQHHRERKKYDVHQKEVPHANQWIPQEIEWITG
jgi:hypothetical protein